MFTIIFTVIAITFSAMCSVQGMEIVSEPLADRKVSSLRKLCRDAIVKNIQSPEELDKFAKGDSKYYQLPQEARDKIAKKLPGRPHRECRIQRNCQVKKVVCNENLQKCMILGDDKVDLVNSRTGSTLYSFDAPGAVGILLSPDGKKYFLQCKGAHSSCVRYGEICYFNQDGFVRNRIDKCLFASFSPTGNELILQQANGLSLWDIDSSLMVCSGFQNIQFCSAGKRLLMRARCITHVIDNYKKGMLLNLGDSDDLLLRLIKTFENFITSDGKKLFRQKINDLYQQRFQGELYDVDSGEIVLIPLLYQVTKNPFSPDGNYLLFSHNNESYLWDVRSGKKIVTFGNDGMEPEFVLGGKYLFIKTPKQRSHVKKYGCVISVDELIAYVAENEKEEIAIEDIPKKAETHDCHNLLFPPFGHYVVHRLDKQVWLIDLLQNKSVLLKKKATRVIFSVYGQMLLLQKKCGDNKHCIDIIRFDNDLTIEQFLLKKLIIVNALTEQQVITDNYLCSIYNSLSSVQKKHFVKQVFKEL